MKRVISIEGMNCSHCTSSVEKALLNVPGVSEAKADLASKSATVQSVEGVSDDNLSAAVTGAGFTVLGIQAQ